MKYMGHKGRILLEIRAKVEQLSDGASSLCDPFCGSGVVAWDLAEQFDMPVVAGDLQSFASARAAAIVTRSKPISDLSFMSTWFRRARDRIARLKRGLRIPSTPFGETSGRVLEVRGAILRSRKYVRQTLSVRLESSRSDWPITMAYAGYYYSIEQALILDAMRATLPSRKDERSVALCALISAASRCSASPGHTAQPLGVNTSSLPHVLDAWNRPVLEYVEAEVRELAPRHARIAGKTLVGSWETAITSLNRGDVVFCDPPYSDVHYSRFYHVLETLSRGVEISVSGTGRNPPFEERPASQFSRRTKAMTEVKKLMELTSQKHLKLVITFPVVVQSNGLEARSFKAMARQHFRHVEGHEVSSVFSSLGGNGKNGTRPAREERIEEIICCY